MYAKVENDIVVRVVKGRGSIREGNYTPQWLKIAATEAELNALGWYEVVRASGKHPEFYNNQSPTYDYAAGVVTEVIVSTPHNFAAAKKRQRQRARRGARGILSEFDWYASRKAENDTAIPAVVITYRNDIRTQFEVMKTAINACVDMDALETLVTGNDGADPPVPNMPQFPDPDDYALQE